MFDVCIPVPTGIDCYAAHVFVTRRLRSIGIEPQRPLFCINPLDEEELIIRTGYHEARRLGESSPMVTAKDGEEYHFAVRALAQRNSATGRRVEVSEKKEWARRRLQGIGVTLRELVLKPSYAWCGKGRGFHLPEIVALGKLVVEDAVKLNVAMATGSGISRSRAFGYGLLQLLPV